MMGRYCDESDLNKWTSLYYYMPAVVVLDFDTDIKYTIVLIIYMIYGN